MLQFSTASFGDSGSTYREQMFTRLECAEFLLTAGASVEPAIWEGAMRACAKGMLQLVSRHGVLPHTLTILAALGDESGVRDWLESARIRPAHPTQEGADDNAITRSFLCACRCQQRPVAALLLNRCIELNPTLGERIDKWRGRGGLIDYLAEDPEPYGSF